MKQDTNWASLRSARPAVHFVNRRSGKNQWSDLGFAADQSGWIVLKDLDDEVRGQIAASKAEKGVTDWAPLPAASARFGLLTAIKAQLTVDGVSVAGYVEPGSSRCFLQLTDEYLLGSFVAGHLLCGFDSDGTPERGKYESGTGKGICLMWRWPLADIEEIEVDRAKRMFKWWDAQLGIYGPDRRSHIRLESINDEGKTVPGSGSFANDLTPFAQALAAAVASARGQAELPKWDVDGDRGDESHVVKFGAAVDRKPMTMHEFLKPLRGEE
jgi:hypothetical protein